MSFLLKEKCEVEHNTTHCLWNSQFRDWGSATLALKIGAEKPNTTSQRCDGPESGVA